MNTPNKLTVLRIALVPFFVFFLLVPSIPHHYLFAGLLFGLASITDHYDGKLARKNGQITDFGKFLDPLADKILVISALICFVETGLVPAWMVIVIVAREFMVTSIRLVAVESGKVVAANNWGKAKTVSQIVAIVTVIVFQYVLELIKLHIIPQQFFNGMFMPINQLFDIVSYAALLFSVAMTVISGGIYLWDNRQFINKAK